ncbi:hypothetical protein LMH87_011019 [Akanthomyces muscarius]|uniref:Uncharacterized protein n=1 Tax=Akanthomyces muscarius TaxID=2231603 RepID=A0A9W8UKJ1_AKAMU|nr:hypothetical protein LMH87_011019 [Akanthomyces muscarius]KAJ4150261.1 hypothetical protein LMH87_011019 [Akanthomyces muscarius]
MMLVLPVSYYSTWGGPFARSRLEKEQDDIFLFEKHSTFICNRHPLILGQNPAKNIRLGLPLELLHLRLAQYYCAVPSWLHMP